LARDQAGGALIDELRSHGHHAQRRDDVTERNVLSISTMRALAVLAATLALLAIPATARSYAGPWTSPAFEDLQGEATEETSEEPDCLYAAAAAWEAWELGKHPTERQVFDAFWENDENTTVWGFSHYWTHHAIDGVRARLVQLTRMPDNGYGAVNNDALLVSLDLGNLPNTAVWNSYYEESFPEDAGHTVLMLSHSRRSVRVVSWGLEWELPIAEWQAMEPTYYAVHRVHS
jgi:hypothetical protein